ncbi:hypothetical protein CDL15_Pgr017844 [Punica granatum]|uniref:Uncharacterized protein n=1 Tax=Punica granatum TaxID=22663 RepID=A0A218WIA4_PUNGR|nr:hypothetical protein CDL15_Pgr017844 [Punica granatum]
MDYLREEEQQLVNAGADTMINNRYCLIPFACGRSELVLIMALQFMMHEMKGHLNDFGYKEPNRMWYLLPESNLDADLVGMNIDPDVMSMAEVGLKYEIVTVYTEADRMEDSSDDGMDARVAGDGDEDDTNDDVWEVEDVKRMRLRRMTLS